MISDVEHNQVFKCFLSKNNMKKKRLFNVSVSELISELFYPRSFNPYEIKSGSMIQYKLGFMNYEKFSKYVDMGDSYVKICGVPDRISYEDGKLYVDELKTTFSGRENYIRKVGTAQLQLYMMITGIDEGRLFIYYKDRNKLVHDSTVRYDENFARDIIRRYLKIRELKEEFRKI